jgi:cystathionine beta-synthase
MRALHQGLDPDRVTIREVMARPLFQLDATVNVDEAYRLLMAGNPAVVVARDGRPAGIVTRSDLMAFYGRTRRAKG